MKTEDIILIENNAGGEIHLVKDRLFWQAWERSAFLFVHNFKNYKVHHRFVQKVMQDFVWLGFPEKALGAILATAKSKNFVVKNISDSHIVISNIPNRGGFDAWKENAINSNKVEKGVIPSPDNKSLSQKSDYLLFRLVYDFSRIQKEEKMKNRQLYKYGLKVYGFEFMNGKGRECLEKVVQNDTRRYPLCDEVNLLIRTSYGTLNVVTAPGFMFDGRSGPKIVDWYAPNLGTLEERVCWLVHDCNGYGQDLSFEDTNLLLFAMLRDLAGYRTSKANVIQLAVSLSDSWYGEPQPDEWCYCNKDKVKTVWIPKAG